MGSNPTGVSISPFIVSFFIFLACAFQLLIFANMRESPGFGLVLSRCLAVADIWSSACNTFILCSMMPILYYLGVLLLVAMQFLIAIRIFTVPDVRTCGCNMFTSSRAMLGFASACQASNVFASYLSHVPNSNCSPHEFCRVKSTCLCRTTSCTVT